MTGKKQHDERNEFSLRVTHTIVIVLIVHAKHNRLYGAHAIVVYARLTKILFEINQSHKTIKMHHYREQRAFYFIKANA